MRIVYMGTPEFAVAPLRRLVEGGYNVTAVVTMPDKVAGRGLKMQESAVKQYALSAGIPVLQPEKLKDPAFVEAFRALRPDLGIVIAFRMLPEVIWKTPRLGTFNLHASLLPQYRGAAPINRAIMAGETRTGVTTFLLNNEIDRGDILGQCEVDILPDDDAGTLHDKLMAVGTELVVETVEKIAVRRAVPVAQPAFAEGVPLREAPKIFKGDCRIDWRCDAATIRNLIRGLSPYPAAWTELADDPAENTKPLPVKIFAVQIEKNPLQGKLPEPGTILTDGKRFLQVACGDGILAVEALQPPGKRRMNVAEWLRGFRLPSGARFI